MERKPACSSDANSDARRGERAGRTEYMEKDLTSGSVLKNIFTFSLPYLLSYFLQTLYGMADLFLVPSSMLSTVSALGAQNIGAGKYDRVDKILRYAIAIGVGFGAVMALLMQFIAPSMVRPFTSDEAVVKAGAAYIRSYIFDCLFAGIQFSFCVILKRKSIRLSKSDFCPRKATMKDILSIGLPVAAQDGFIQVSFMLITIMANQRGLTDAAAVGIVEKIISFLFLVPSSMLSTVSALGAQNIGAGKYDRVDKILRYAIAIGVGFGAVMALLMQFIAPSMVRPFTSDEAVVKAGAAYIRSYIFDCLFAGIQFSFSGYFCAWGRSGLSFLHNTLSILLVRVPGAWLACRFFPQTLVPMGLAPACGSLFSSIVCILLYRWMKRQNKPTGDKD